MTTLQEIRPRTAMRQFYDRPGILVVDDEPMIRNILVELFERRGFRGWTAADGSDALETYRAHHDDITLVLAEVSLSAGPAGPRFLQELRRIDPSVRCCFMDSSPWNSDDRELLELGAEEVV